LHPPTHPFVPHTHRTQGVNCCAELQRILSLCCPAEGACAGVPASYRAASCGEQLGLFAAVPLGTPPPPPLPPAPPGGGYNPPPPPPPTCPYFPDGLAADYTCLAFPNDDNPRDSFIVALIALAGARRVWRAAARCLLHARPPRAS
jgi:hypothetical protein